jgi:hypothetical protein
LVTSCDLQPNAGAKEHNVIVMSSPLEISFAEVLLMCQTMKDDLDALLHPEYGFAARLRQICHDQYTTVHSIVMFLTNIYTDSSKLRRQTMKEFLKRIGIC